MDHSLRTSDPNTTGDRSTEVAAHTPGPWEYVPSTKDHGPYVTSQFGSTICDCYVMSNPNALSVRNGGDSRPIHHLHEMADPNARLIAAAPELVAPFDAADNGDWRALDLLLGHSAHGQFWRGVFKEFRAAITKATGGAS